MPGQVRIKDHQREQRSFLQRSAAAAAVIAGLAVLLLGRLVLLQIVRYDYYLDQAQGNRTRIEPIPANRGLILDRNGKILAENQPSYQLELVREQLPLRKEKPDDKGKPDVEGTLRGLQQLGIIPADEIDNVKRMIAAHRGFESVPIKLRLSEEQISLFAVHRHEFPGIDIQARSTRYYPHGALAVHALGYVGAITEQDLARIDHSTYAGTALIGRQGVESAREAELHGVNGYQEILVNAQGRSVSRKGMELKKQPPRAGSDLILSLDLPSQQAAEDAFAGRRGAAIAIDPHTGDVLVLASMPGFDAGIFGRGITNAEYRALERSIDLPLYNRALKGIYPPGSTVKPVLGMAALAYGIVRPEETRFCPGYYIVPGSSRRAREGKGGIHGSVDLRSAIAESCDVYFYGVAVQLGPDRIHEFLSPFGFGKPTGIDIAGERSGLLPSREWKRDRYKKKDPSEGVWYPGDSVNFGIGQGFMSVTPMQLAQVTSVLAAKGSVFKPRLVTAIRDPVTGQTQKLDPVPMPNVKGGTPEQWDVIMEGMRATMTRGTAKAISTSAEYAMAGKTGTAQAFSVGQNERYVASQVNERLRDHSWFIAFAPAEAPQIAIAVLVENGGFGASAAAPIARKIMDAYLLPRLNRTPPAPTAAPPVPEAEGPAQGAVAPPHAEKATASSQPAASPAPPA